MSQNIRPPHPEEIAIARREALLLLRAESHYGALRVAVGWLCFLLSITAIVAWWPWAADRSTRSGFTFDMSSAAIAVLAVVFTWIVGALVRAYLDGCDLALRREQRAEQK